MSGTVTSRELVYHKFHKRRDFLSEILPLPFGGFPNPPLKNFMLGVKILKERKVQLKMRATEKEKVRIENKAKKCGLSVSEYIRKRALGYSPKALLPESFYEFTEKIGILYEALGTLNSTELQAEVLKLLDEIYAKLLVTDKGKVESESDD